ncbi:hypothetical protein ACFFX0_27845 [Citricoccus parietis]|uniref:Uncharacterized protein n=1 Tax=Citricoccus parietis TaxID=592307 RepID=A0ABV5G795_9MICC
MVPGAGETSPPWWGNRPRPTSLDASSSGPDRMVRAQASLT